MRPFTVEFDVSGGSVATALDGLDARLEDLSGPLEAFGRVMMESVTRNFAEQGRPQRWKPLAESTVRRKGSDLVLIDTGALMCSTGFRASPDGLSVFAKAYYAAVHQRGGRAGIDGSALIPARPFLVFQDEDAARLKGLLTGHLLGREGW